MSAPNSAYTIGPFKSEDGKNTEALWGPRVECTCGWKGRLGNLLGVEENDTLWCPECRQYSGWTYV